MIDMKIKPKKSDEKKSCGCCMPVETADSEPYPYGLQITLNKESLETLGLTADQFQAGAVVTLAATAKVKGIRTSDGDSSYDNSVELQITAMDLSGGLRGKGAKFLSDRAKGPGEEVGS